MGEEELLPGVERPSYLTQSTFQFSKEVIVAQVNGFIVNVVNSKF